MSASASDLAIKPPRTVLEAIAELNSLKDTWQGYVNQNAFRWPNIATKELILVEYSYLLDQSSRLCRRVKLVASVLEQQRESMLQSMARADEDLQRAVLASERCAAQLESEQKKSAALADEIRTLRLELQQGQKTVAMHEVRAKEGEGTVYMQGVQAQEIMQGAAYWYSLMRRQSLYDQKSRLPRPTSEGKGYSPDCPEIVLRDKDYLKNSLLTAGDHGLIFSCSRSLEEIMHDSAEKGFRLYIINQAGDSVYHGVYTAFSWPNKAMTGLEYLELPAKTRNTIISHASGASPGTELFNAVHEDFACSRRVVPCSLLQCLQQPLPNPMPPRRPRLVPPPPFQPVAPPPRPVPGQLYDSDADAMQSVYNSPVPPAPAPTPVHALSPLNIPHLRAAGTSTNSAPAPAPLRQYGPLYNQRRYATTISEQSQRSSQTHRIYETAKIASGHWAAASGSAIPILPPPGQGQVSYGGRAGWA